MRTVSSMKKLVIILAVVTLASCKEASFQNQYSAAFYKTIVNKGIELRNDSLLFPKESGLEEPILIPNILKLGEEYLFKSGSGLELKLKRKNLTDIEYRLEGGDVDECGMASLIPTFYMGTESVETSEGEFWITPYETVTSEFIRSIGIGEEGLSDEIVEGIYVSVNPKPDSKYKKLVVERELWKLQARKD